MKATLNKNPYKPSGLSWPILITSIILGIILLAALLAPILAPYNPDKIDLFNSLASPSTSHWLGTDKSGRDLLSRLLFGGRTTLLSAISVVGISIAVGVPLGLVSGYFGGVVDGLIMRVWDVLLAFPALLLAFIFVGAMGKNLFNAILAIGIVYIPMISRLARSLAMTEKNKVYVNAARSLGYSDIRILFRHILPNCIATLVAELTLDLGYAILDLAALNFIGLGVQPPVSDWGAMMQEGLVNISTNPIIVLAPSIAIVITVVSINILSDGIQAALDPKQRKLPSVKLVKKLLGQAGKGRGYDGTTA